MTDSLSVVEYERGESPVRIPVSALPDICEVYGKRNWFQIWVLGFVESIEGVDVFCIEKTEHARGSWKDGSPLAYVPADALPSGAVTCVLRGDPMWFEVRGEVIGTETGDMFEAAQMKYLLRR